jgi:hypothetical protein
MYAFNSSMSQKCSNHALTNLLFNCSMWIIDLFVTHLSPHPEALACPFTPEVLWTKECTPTPSFVVFTFELAFESFKECGCLNLCENYRTICLCKICGLQMVKMAWKMYVNYFYINGVFFLLMIFLMWICTIYVLTNFVQSLWCNFG